MTTLNPLLQRVTHPQRAPFVRATTFVDGKGPPPYGFFDEVQDHVGALYHAALGWRYSLDTDEFTEAKSRPGFLGRMRVVSVTGGVTPAPAPVATGFSEHGFWSVQGVGMPWRIQARSASVTLDGDFLMTAKVRVVGPDLIDSVANLGFLVGTGSPSSDPVCPAFVAGSDSPTWWLRYAPDPQASPVLADTGVTVGNATWYRLQVSRVAGAIRFFINGLLARPGGAEGVYYPHRLLTGCKWLEAGYSKPGPAGFGVDVDSFHLLAERSNA